MWIGTLIAAFMNFFMAIFVEADRDYYLTICNIFLAASFILIQMNQDKKDRKDK